ncbi:MAG: thioredoxin family protein [Gammaproteobacteria bacterium]|nr:thioredoxin family protein [Gammaproteobacteria bacterium]
MKSNVIFYHAGCPVCIEAESKVIQAMDQSRYDIEIVHLAEQPDRLQDAETRGVRSVPAMVLDNEVFHINFGAALADLKTSHA